MPYFGERSLLGHEGHYPCAADHRRHYVYLGGALDDLRLKERVLYPGANSHHAVVGEEAGVAASERFDGVAGKVPGARQRVLGQLHSPTEREDLFLEYRRYALAGHRHRRSHLLVGVDDAADVRAGLVYREVHDHFNGRKI